MFLPEEIDEDALFAFLDENGGQVRDWTVEPVSPEVTMPEYGLILFL